MTHPGGSLRSILSAAVLAGGESRRMGRDKALLDFEGRPLIIHVVESLRELSDDVFVVSKRKAQLEALRLCVVGDYANVQTPLAGVLAALRAARHPLVFVCATDMPFVSHDLVAQLTACAQGVDVAVPMHDDTLEPLHAVWSSDCAPTLERTWNDGERSVRGALERLDVRIVDVPSTRSFTNVNTPEDLDALRG